MKKIPEKHFAVENGHNYYESYYYVANFLHEKIYEKIKENAADSHHYPKKLYVRTGF